MPNVLDLLDTDHREVEQLFAQFESTQDFEIALQICRELSVHAAVEEEIHDEAKELIASIQSMSPDDPEVVPVVMELKGAIEHHVEEEESEAWGEMRKGAADRLHELGEAVAVRKAELQADDPEAARR